MEDVLKLFLFFRMGGAEETSTKIRQWSRMMAPRWLRFDMRSSRERGSREDSRRQAASIVKGW
jgi:hypothetical protein